MTHQWVGLIEGRASWFEEGLTVYVTATLPCEAHLSTPEECAHDLNRNLLNYYASEAKNWLQKQIDNTPFTNESAREVPYARGALYFANLNFQLLAKSNGARGLKETSIRYSSLVVMATVSLRRTLRRCSGVSWARRQSLSFAWR
jgi:hypothetical protein